MIDVAPPVTPWRAPARLVVIGGPTAVGKSAIAIELALRLGGEIVEADSRHVYREFDIGTGKETEEERRGVPFHLVDVVDPTESWTASDFQLHARASIDDIARRGKIPFLVGGTGLYLSGIVDGLTLPSVPPRPDLRAELEAEIQAGRYDRLLEELGLLDPLTASTIDTKNARRVIRALEVCRTLGAPFSSVRTSTPLDPPPLFIALDTNRPTLHRKADDRLDRMVARGWVSEVTRLLERYPPHLAAFTAVGYREVARHVRGDCSLDAALSLAYTATHAFQRRQLTWLRKRHGVVWLDSQDDTVVSVIERKIEEYGSASPRTAP